MEEGIFSLGYNNGWRHRLSLNKATVPKLSLAIHQLGLISNIVDYVRKLLPSTGDELPEQGPPLSSRCRSTCLNPVHWFPRPSRSISVTYPRRRRGKRLVKNTMPCVRSYLKMSELFKILQTAGNYGFKTLEDICEILDRFLPTLKSYPNVGCFTFTFNVIHSPAKIFYFYFFNLSSYHSEYVSEFVYPLGSKLKVQIHLAFIYKKRIILNKLISCVHTKTKRNSKNAIKLADIFVLL